MNPLFAHAMTIEVADTTCVPIFLLVYYRFKVILDVATVLVYLHTDCEERIIHLLVYYRFEVILDVATVLMYLYIECKERIIHRNVKATNVMLNAKFNACIGDFGLV